MNLLNLVRVNIKDTVALIVVALIVSIVDFEQIQGFSLVHL